MAEKAVSDIKDTGKDLLGRITDMEVFRADDQVIKPNNKQAEVKTEYY